MSEHAELVARRDALQAELASAEARVAALTEVRVDPALPGLERAVAALRAHAETLEAEVLEGREQVAALREDVARVESLGGIP